jgi:FOG: TPR repeat, SEL1 subfamily
MASFRSKYSEAYDAYNNDEIDHAIGLMKKFAEQEDVKACLSLAWWYYRSGDHKNSIFWWSEIVRLAKQDNAEAQWQLGEYYRLGNFVPFSLEESEYWCKRAADNGSGEAQCYLGYLYKYDPTKKDKTLSDYWYQKAFEQGEPEALCEFATRRLHTNNSDKQAIAWLQEAADKGFDHAQEILDQFSAH